MVKIVEILKPILNKLNQAFPELKVYTDYQEQGVETPCFFVKIVSTDLDPQMGNLYFMRNRISITYMSDNPDLYDLEEVRFKMLFALKDIPTKYGLEARNMSTRILGGDIVLTANYDLLIEEEEATTLMKTLDIERGVKSGNNKKER